MLDWLPNPHPIIVHFPIALLTVAVIVDVVALFRRNISDTVVSWLYAGGTLTLIPAFLSGRHAVDTVVIPAGAQAIQTDHADWALITLIFFLVFLTARLLLLRFMADRAGLVRIVSAVAGLVGAGLLTVTGDLGGRMVYAHAVGVTIPPPPEALRPDLSQVADLDVASAILGYPVSAVAGDLDEAVLGPDSTVLTLHLDRDELTLVTDDRFGAVQVEMEVNLDRFSGDASLLYGFVSPDQTDFIEIGGGSIEQSRRQGGDTETFDRGVLTPSGWFKWIGVTDGTHFRGYVDEALIVHGHGDPSPEGAVGLSLDGSGVVLVRGLTVSPLR